MKIILSHSLAQILLIFHPSQIFTMYKTPWNLLPTSPFTWLTSASASLPQAYSLSATLASVDSLDHAGQVPASCDSALAVPPGIFFSVLFILLTPDLLWSLLKCHLTKEGFFDYLSPLSPIPLFSLYFDSQYLLMVLIIYIFYLLLSVSHTEM